MNIKTMFFALTSLVMFACGPTAEERVRAYEEAHEAMMQENITLLNKELPAYSQISRVKVYHEEFEKTPKRSIKRYLYQHG